MHRYGWIAAGLALAAFDAVAIEIELGERRLSIAVPDGFTELTPEMSPYYELMQAYVFPQNRRYLMLVSVDTAEKILGAEVLELGRYMNLETTRQWEEVPMPRATFDEIRGTVRTQLTRLYENLAPELPGVLDDASGRAGEAFDVDIAVSVGDMKVFPVHLDTANAIGHSMYMRSEAVVNGETVSNVLAVTQISLYVQDKLLFLYVYGHEADLEWTRSAAADWAATILAANGAELGAAPVADEAAEDVPVDIPMGGASRNEVAMRALIGIGLALLLGIVLSRLRSTPGA